MRNMFNKKPKPVESSAFSEFIRNASSREKKRVYATVLKKATEKQNAIIEKSRAITG